ncbi:MAG TPA: hypothetical protein VIO60_06755, partial [Rectinemataceae bacterium]
MEDASRYALHTITTKPWPLPLAARKYAEAGITGVSVWKESLGGLEPREAARILADAGLAVVSTVRGGFFVAPDAHERAKRIEENLDFLRMSAELGAP